MNSNVLIAANYRPLPPTDRFLEQFTLRQPTDETLYACQIFNGAGTIDLRQYCRLLRGERRFRKSATGSLFRRGTAQRLETLNGRESECESDIPDDSLYCLSFKQ